jgi:hypothetical protein
MSPIGVKLGETPLVSLSSQNLKYKASYFKGDGITRVGIWETLESREKGLPTAVPLALLSLITDPDK